MFKNFLRKTKENNASGFTTVYGGGSKSELFTNDNGESGFRETIEFTVHESGVLQKRERIITTDTMLLDGKGLLVQKFLQVYNLSDADAEPMEPTCVTAQPSPSKVHSIGTAVVEEQGRYYNVIEEYVAEHHETTDLLKGD